MTTDTNTTRCPVLPCEAAWHPYDLETPDELTRARVYHLAAFHSLTEVLDVMDDLMARLRGTEAELEAAKEAINSGLTTFPRR